MADQSLCLIIGEDVLHQLNQWREWEEIFELAHIIAVSRTTNFLSAEPWLVHLMQQRETHDKNDLTKEKAGKIYR